METTICPVCKQTIYGRRGVYTCLKCGIFEKNYRTMALERTTYKKEKLYRALKVSILSTKITLATPYTSLLNETQKN